ncbi:hypothetical protein SAMN02799624_05170 [Paenibacillus sp. UNC496MF]|nr:hypothetical protein SAMN02799624_05170 [Paenibacillus sp. UNC496MF]
MMKVPLKTLLQGQFLLCSLENLGQKVVGSDLQERGKSVNDMQWVVSSLLTSKNFSTVLKKTELTL